MRIRTVVPWMLLAASACGSRTVRNGEAGREVATPPEPPDAGGVESAAGPSDAEKRLLLSLARSAVERRLRDRGWPRVDPACVTAYIEKPLACFVTLETLQGDLRGCIGMFESDRPLHENVMDRAVAAAFADPRFPPVEASELPGLLMEISILTEPRPLEFSSPEDLLARVHPGIDGVSLHTRWGSSTFLPQVWEQLPEKEEFLGRLCEKHGAPSDCWRDEALRVEIYHAVVFSEEEHGRRDRDWFTVTGDGGYDCPAEAPAQPARAP